MDAQARAGAALAAWLGQGEMDGAALTRPTAPRPGRRSPDQADGAQATVDGPRGWAPSTGPGGGRRRPGPARRRLTLTSK